MAQLGHSLVRLPIVRVPCLVTTHVSNTHLSLCVLKHILSPQASLTSKLSQYKLNFNRRGIQSIRAAIASLVQHLPLVQGGNSALRGVNNDNSYLNLNLLGCAVERMSKKQSN
jgi:hypothetical protein